MWQTEPLQRGAWGWYAEVGVQCSFGDISRFFSASIVALYSNRIALCIDK